MDNNIFIQSAQEQDCGAFGFSRGEFSNLLIDINVTFDIMNISQNENDSLNFIDFIC